MKSIKSMKNNILKTKRFKYKKIILVGKIGKIRKI